MSLTPFRMRLALIGGVLVGLLFLAGWLWWSQPDQASPLKQIAAQLSLPSAVEQSWNNLNDNFGEGATLPEDWNSNQTFSLDQLSIQSHPLSIPNQRQQTYQGSDLIYEQDLGVTGNYHRYVASYQSEGLKIYGLLTIPTGEQPPNGWPIIIFNHGYIPPEQYRTTLRYEAYQGYFARNGYITFKSDYRGHGDSEGDPEGGFYSPAYTADVLNAKASVQRLPEANANQVGFWGHSMGGFITQRSMVIADDIDAGVIWGGVVGSYQDIYESRRRRRANWTPSPAESRSRRQASSSSQLLYERYGEPNFDSDFWRLVDPVYYLADVSGPIQLHHGQADDSVEWELSQKFNDHLSGNNAIVELFLYPGADHNLSGNAFSPAMQRSLEFFDRHVKQAE